MMKLSRLIPTQPAKRRVYIAGGIIAAAVLTSASIFATGPSAAPAPHVEKAWPVSVTRAEPQRIHPTFAAFGKLESNRTARLRSDLVARVVAVNVREGDWVEAGETLVRLDHREAELVVLERRAELKQHQANLASMRARLALEQQSSEHFESRYRVARDKLKRHQDLMHKKLISKALLDEVMSQTNDASIEYRNHVRELTNLPNDIAAHEASVARAEALLRQAELDLSETEIRAPFAGPVIGVFAAPGDYSNLSAPLVELAEAAGFEVRVQIPDAYTSEFHRALDTTARIEAHTDTDARLRLTRLSGHVRQGQTGTDAFFAFTGAPPQALTLGRVFSLSVVLPAQADLIPVPVQSIYENNRVYAVREGRLVGIDTERVGERETGARGYEVLIRSSQIQPGEQIMTTQLPKAIHGLLVDIAQG